MNRWSSRNNRLKFNTSKKTSPIIFYKGIYRKILQSNIEKPNDTCLTGCTRVLTDYAQKSPRTLMQVYIVWDPHVPIRPWPQSPDQIGLRDEGGQARRLRFLQFGKTSLPLSDDKVEKEEEEENKLIWSESWVAWEIVQHFSGRELRKWWGMQVVS